MFGYEVEQTDLNICTTEGAPATSKDAPDPWAVTIRRPWHGQVERCITSSNWSWILQADIYGHV